MTKAGGSMNPSHPVRRLPRRQRLPTTPEERMIDNFWHRVRSTQGCWVWQGSVNRYGYGIFRGQLVHRFAYRLLVGAVEGFVIRHTCDNPICVRPDHLIAGTQKQNMADKVARGRAVGGAKKQTGEGNNNAKITVRQAQFALDLWARGYRQVDIAYLAGLTLSNTNNIVHRQTWKHLIPRPQAIQEAPRVPRRDRRSRWSTVGARNAVRAPRDRAKTVLMPDDGASA